MRNRFGTGNRPPSNTRKRQYPDEPDLGGITAKEIHQRNRIDTLVSQRANEAFAKHSDGGTHNPFGFDAKARERFGGTARTSMTRDERIERAYSRLFDLLRGQDRLVSVHQLPPIHISDPTRLLGISYAVFCMNKTTTH